jgi:hypothetical protein
VVDSVGSDPRRLRLVEERDKELEGLLRERLRFMDTRLQELEEQKGVLERQMLRLRDERRHVVALLGDERTAPTSSGLPGPEAPGGSPADMVVQLLSEVGPLHYTEIERMLRERGWYVASGSNPASTLLAHYYGDDRLFRPYRGTYALRKPGHTQPSVGIRRSRKRRTRRGTAQTKG